MAARPGDKHVLDVLPQFPMLLQVDLYGDLAALFIGYILDSDHSFIVPQGMLPACFTPGLTVKRLHLRPTASLNTAGWHQISRGKEWSLYSYR